MELIQIYPTRLCEEYARGYNEGYDAGLKDEDGYGYARGYRDGYEAADSNAFSRGMQTVFWFFYRLLNGGKSSKSPSEAVNQG